MQKILNLLIFLLFTHNVSATITIADSGIRFPSEPDQWYSSHFAPGFEYMAHLQVLFDNLDLCTGNSTVTRPADNVPVVLLARRDTCDDWTKIQFAKTRVQPRGVVQYLIIYETDEEIPMDQKLLPSQKNIAKNQIYGLTDVDTGVLHVGASTGKALLQIVVGETYHTRSSGGTRVLLNGLSSSRIERQAMLRKVLFWFGITFLVSGCCCSFVLSVRLQMLDDDDDSTVAPRRPERRRLTMEQVEEWVPECVYHENGNTTDNASTSTPVECTVCLDPFSDGDYIRRLPCQHEFHSYCIAKWLVERNSTCPLCKLDLLPEDNHSSSSDEEIEEEASIVDTSDVPDLPTERRESTFARLWGQFWRNRRSAFREVDVDQTPLLSHDGSSNIELERISDEDNDDAGNNYHDDESRPYNAT